MPRTRKTSSGENAQPIQAIRGQEYGQGVAQERMQSSMPAPQMQSVAAAKQPNVQNAETIPNQVVSSESSQAQMPPSRMELAQLQEMLRGVGGVLRQPDDRPDISYTQTLDDPAAQMRIGTMPAVNRTGEMMRELSRRTGDSTFADLAARAGL